MLLYIESSKRENIKNANIAAIHKFVEKVKQDKEVGVNYMKSWEWEEIIRKRATEEGLAEGRAEGHAEGRAEGHAEGYREGYTEGEKLKLISQVRKKFLKQYSSQRISEELEEENLLIEEILSVIQVHSDYDDRKIYEILWKKPVSSEPS